MIHLWRGEETEAVVGMTAGAPMIALVVAYASKSQDSGGTFGLESGFVSVFTVPGVTIPGAATPTTTTGPSTAVLYPTP